MPNQINSFHPSQQQYSFPLQLFQNSERKQSSSPFTSMIIPLPFSPELCNSSQFGSLAQSMSSVHSVYPGMLPTRGYFEETEQGYIFVELDVHVAGDCGDQCSLHSYVRVCKI
ncbi:uncharacterized protein LOC105785617 isoform X2 [Gossypium raimondii]|uniref:uncharacterized protein LOC105785617 isoform X2 n=1 Tax=Gossypium raimondii TaxID=29730 RepID=UPI00063AEB0A|nr:uncharacterized protein LOC105785617 isoform X2 [Gossypium raimondii]